MITWVIYLYSTVKYESVTKSFEYRNENIVTWKKMFSFSLHFVGWIISTQASVGGDATEQNKKIKESNKSIWNLPGKVGKGLAIVYELHNTFCLLS